MVNTSFIRTLGVHRERNIVGASLFDLNLRIFSDPAIKRNVERIQQSSTYLTEMQHIEDSTNHIYLLEFTPTVSHVGKPGIMISLRDITAWKNAEAALKNSEKKIRTIFETVPSGIIFFTADGIVLNANRASLDILGLRNFQELMNGNIFSISCYKGKILEPDPAGRGRRDRDRLRLRSVETRPADPEHPVRYSLLRRRLHPDRP
ncbi:MAG: PAS domain-containing protein [Methanoculleus sp.]